MAEVESASVEDTLKSLNQALEESRRLRENLQYLPSEHGSLCLAHESTKQGDEALLAPT